MYKYYRTKFFIHEPTTMKYFYCKENEDGTQLLSFHKETDSLFDRMLILDKSDDILDLLDAAVAYNPKTGKKVIIPVPTSSYDIYSADINEDEAQDYRMFGAIWIPHYYRGEDLPELKIACEFTEKGIVVYQ